MAQTALWTRKFIAIMMANGFFFVSFHSLLPTLPYTLLRSAQQAQKSALLPGFLVYRLLAFAFSQKT